MSLKLVEAFTCEVPKSRHSWVKALWDSIRHRYRVATGYFDKIIEQSRHEFHVSVDEKLHYFLDELDAPFDSIRFAALEKALRETDRYKFVDTASINQLWWPHGRAFTPYEDKAIQILSALNVPFFERKNLNKDAYEQTCSQPSLVLFMLYLLHLQPGMKVLEIWWGCGYAATLAAKAIWESGKVVSIEYFEEVYKRGLQNIEREFGENYADRVKFICWDGSQWMEKEWPFNAILLSAWVWVEFNTKKLELQLVEWWRLVLPDQMWRVRLYILRSWRLELEWEGLNVWFVPLRWMNSNLQ